jgi:mRNA-degrading endonuclease toxin of MazEF toxin-antitoxin module
MFELVLPSDGSVVGVVLCDQVKSFDWRNRQVQYIDKVSEVVVKSICLKIAKLIGLTIQ